MSRHKATPYSVPLAASFGSVYTAIEVVYYSSLCPGVLFHFWRTLSAITNCSFIEGGKDLEPGADVAGRPPFTWHPNQSAAQILAIGDDGGILFADVPAAADAAADTGQIICDATATQLPTGMACVQCPGLVTALTFSADGSKLAAVVGQNEVSPAMQSYRPIGCTKPSHKPIFCLLWICCCFCQFIDSEPELHS